MTYAENLKVLKTAVEMKAAVVDRYEAEGFVDAGDVIAYLMAERELQEATSDYHQYFSRCIQLKVNLNQEI